MSELISTTGNESGREYYYEKLLTSVTENYGGVGPAQQSTYYRVAQLICGICGSVVHPDYLAHHTDFHEKIGK